MSDKYRGIGYEGEEIGWADVSAPISPTLSKEEMTDVYNNIPSKDALIAELVGALKRIKQRQHDSGNHSAVGMCMAMDAEEALSTAAKMGYLTDTK